MRLRAVAVLCVVSAFTGHASAYASEESALGEAVPDVAMSNASLPYVKDVNQTSTNLWVWSKGQRAYLLVNGEVGKGFKSIVALDTNTGTVIDKRNLEQPGYTTPQYNARVRQMGQDRSMVIDEEGGRLFVATQLGLGARLTAPMSLTEMVSNRQLCAQLATPSPPLGCLTGVSVLDALTLDEINHIRLDALMLDGSLVAIPQLLAMDYAPPSATQSDKVYLLVQDNALGAGGTDSLPRGTFAKQLAPTRTFLVQMDPAADRQDWIIPLPACAGARVGRTSAEQDRTHHLPHEAAVFRGRTADDNAVYVACHFRSSSFTGGVVRVPLDERGFPQTVPVAAEMTPADPAEEEAASSPGDFAPSLDRAPVQGAGPLDVQGPDETWQFLSDPMSGRLLFLVLDGGPLAAVWWVFDTELMRFVGTVGIGAPVETDNTFASLDRRSGTLYVYATPHSKAGKSFQGGLFIADIRSTPVAQALHFPSFAELTPSVFQPGDARATNYHRALSVESRSDGSRRVWLADKFDASPSRYRAIDDRRVLAPSNEDDDFADRTLDLDEIVGVTQATFDAAARGYGFRALFIDGAEAATRFDQADPIGTAEQCSDPSWEDTDGVVGTNVIVVPEERRQGGPCYWFQVQSAVPCLHGNRELILASVGPDEPAIIDGSGSRGAAQPVILDSATMADAQNAASRCAGQDWDRLWSTALFGRPPVEEPGVQLYDEILARCVSGENSDGSAGEPVSRGYGAKVTCDEDESAGHAYARGASVQGIELAEALSSYRIYRDPGRGIVSRVESVARGIRIDGLVRIDMVRGIGEAWASGRKQAVPAAERQSDYKANCDMERTAGTCFQRHLFGLTTPGYRCGPCGDEHAFIDALNAALRSQATARLRDPDERLARGAESGFVAAIQKPEADRYGDLILNADLLQTVLPTLEIVRYASPNRFLSRGGPRGRQIYQFAGVEVSSSYGIQCLLVYDEEANTCAAEAEEPGSLTVSLTDGAEEPLAGGVFEVREDVDADGVVGLVDTLLPDGACVTAEDGIGTCQFDDLQPGSYLVTQIAAPAGFAQVDDTWVSQVASGEARTVAFSNTSNVSTIDVSATDEAGKPIFGAVFAVYPDPDADGKIAADAQPAATCTTNDQGVCSMSVPVGSYVLVQTSAPAGLEGIEPVAFAFASGGQTATVGITNYGAGVPAVEPAAGPVYIDRVNSAPLVETVTDYTPSETVREPQISLPERVGGTVVKVVQAPGDALRLLSRDPQQAMAFTAALMLFALAVTAIRRRQYAVELINNP